jgi:hypothetical protein
MMSKVVIFYLAGSLIWALLLSFMMATQELTNFLIVNYLTLTLGFMIGIFGKKIFDNRPWLLLFVPSLPLIIGFF